MNTMTVLMVDESYTIYGVGIFNDEEKMQDETRKIITGLTVREPEIEIIRNDSTTIKLSNGFMFLILENELNSFYSLLKEV